jgi:polar amino acid transport system permease protein
MSQGWSWQGFGDYLFNPFILGGVLTTVWLTVAAIAGGLVLGFAIALARLSSNPWLNRPARFYIWLFRGTPLLVQLIIIYTGLPQAGLKLSVIESALAGLILNEASPRSCAAASSRSPQARRMPRGRWASPPRRRCATSSCRRPCA